MANTDWENYGDVNFLEYGGLLIRQDPDYMDRSYNVIQVATPWATDEIKEGHVWAWWLTVDLDDGWYDWDAVKSFVGDGAEDDDKQLVSALVAYYGSGEFQAEGLGKDNACDITVEELREALDNLGAGEFA